MDEKEVDKIIKFVWILMDIILLQALQLTNNQSWKCPKCIEEDFMKRKKIVNNTSVSYKLSSHDQNIRFSKPKNSVFFTCRQNGENTRV